MQLRTVLLASSSFCAALFAPLEARAESPSPSVEPEAPAATTPGPLEATQPAEGGEQPVSAEVGDAAVEQAPTEQAKASSAVANGPVPAHLTLKPTLPPTDEELLALEVKIAELDAERSQYSPVGPIIVMGIGYGAAAYAAFALLSEALAGDEECGSPSDEGRYTGSCKDPNRPPTGLVIGVGAVGTGMLLGGGAWLGYRLVKRRDIGAQLETLHKAREERVKLPPAPAPRDELGALGPHLLGESRFRGVKLTLEF